MAETEDVELNPLKLEHKHEKRTRYGVETLNAAKLMASVPTLWRRAV